MKLTDLYFTLNEIEHSVQTTPGITDFNTLHFVWINSTNDVRICTLKVLICTHGQIQL